MNAQSQDSFHFPPRSTGHCPCSRASRASNRGPMVLPRSWEDPPGTILDVQYFSSWDMPRKTSTGFKIFIETIQFIGILYLTKCPKHQGYLTSKAQNASSIRIGTPKPSLVFDKMPLCPVAHSILPQFFVQTCRPTQGRYPIRTAKVKMPPKKKAI